MEEKEKKESAETKETAEIQDYYEFLQISPNAEPATITRVYRFLASRLHPDNPETGDADKFRLLKEAYDVLSDPERRAKYDANYNDDVPPPAPLSTSIDFMDSVDGELNRRLAILALLYMKRRTNPYNPEVSLSEVELRMGFPREYMQFTTWYLWNKKYITQADNSDFTLTALGVDFVESNRGNVPILNKLLTDGSVSTDATGRNRALNPFQASTGITVPESGSSEDSGAGKKR